MAGSHPLIKSKSGTIPKMWLNQVSNFLGQDQNDEKHSKQILLSMKKTRDIKLGKDVILNDFVNLYGCSIDDESKIGPFVEIQKNVAVGKRCKISSHSFLCEGVRIEDEVFIGHGVMFINDRYPMATTAAGELQKDNDWELIPTRVCKGASIGSGATILCGCTIGAGAIVGAGAVVTKNVMPGSVVAGNPARTISSVPPNQNNMEKQGVPFVSMRTMTQPIRKAFMAEVESILDTGSFIQGKHVAFFESSFATSMNLPHAVACSSGTSALHLAIAALEIGFEDEVIVPAMSFAASVWPIIYQSATPVFCDVDPYTHILDAREVEKRITPKTRAIIVVHLYGRVDGMADLCNLAEKHNLVLIEDAAQAHGARLHGKSVGHFGRMACFSFYPSKNLGAAGDAGAVVCKSHHDAKRLRMLREHGQQIRHCHDLIGFNYRMAELQAVFLTLKLPYLSIWNKQRHNAAIFYNKHLHQLPSVSCPQIPEDPESHVFHVYLICLSNQHLRDELKKAFEEQGIGYGQHYAFPLHQQPCFTPWVKKSDHFPYAERLAQTSLSLPMFPGITRQEQKKVIAVVHQVVNR